MTAFSTALCCIVPLKTRIDDPGSVQVLEEPCVSNMLILSLGSKTFGHIETVNNVLAISYLSWRG